MIMKGGGGRLRSDEKWHLDGKEVKITKKYKYLGVEIKPSLDMNEHLNERGSVAKSNLNAVWNNFLSKIDVKFIDKMRTMRVKGFREYECILKFQSWFIKNDGDCGIELSGE